MNEKWWKYFVRYRQIAREMADVKQYQDRIDKQIAELPALWDEVPEDERPGLALPSTLPAYAPTPEGPVPS